MAYIFRQLLRENSHELRDLERKLKAAYVNKELAAQIAQKELEKANRKVKKNFKNQPNIFFHLLLFK